jgi:broad specificity phosphatase PhoE
MSAHPVIERESRANTSGSAAPVARLHDVSLRYGKTRALDAVTLDVPAGVAARAILEPDLVEWNYGKYEGLTPEQIHEQTPCWLIFRDGCPGGETPEHVGARADRVIAQARAVEGDVALFAHGHVLRVLVARWLGLPAGAGQHFLLDTGTVSVLDDYRGIPALKTWNAPLVGYVSPIARHGSEARARPSR